jgi:predicted transcriptional regulator
MSTLTIRLSEEVINKTSQIAKKLALSRNDYIKKCILNMNKNIYEQDLKNKLINSSKLVREDNMRVNAEFDKIEYE